MSNLIEPIATFTDKIGEPLEAGYIYIGESPDAESNPITVYWDSDLTVPANQPIRTVAGYPVLQGVPQRIYCSEVEALITVKQHNGEAVLTNAQAEPLLTAAGSNGIQYRLTRTALAAAPSALNTIYLREAGREGMFGWDGSDLSAEVTLDTEQGIYVPPTDDTTGASGAWVRQETETLNVQWFGAVGDGATDCSTAVQAAIDMLKPVAGYYPVAPRPIYFPAGTYLFATSVKTYTGIQLLGEGATTILEADDTVSDYLIGLEGIDGGIGEPHYRYALIEHMLFRTGAGVWAIQALSQVVLNSEFNDLYFDSVLCGAFNTYTQACTLRKWMSLGNSTDQILNLVGNRNTIEDIDKEGATGSSTDPYILIQAGAIGVHAGNVLRTILIEGTTSANKVPLRIEDGFGTVIEDYWFEGTASTGYALECDQAYVTIYGNAPFLAYSNISKINLLNGSQIHLDSLFANSEPVEWQNYIDRDETSSVLIDRVLTRTGNNSYLIDDSSHKQAKQIWVQDFRDNAFTGYLPYSEPDYTCGQNLLINPSFESGIYGWGFTPSSPDLVEFIDSEVAQGKMAHLVATSALQMLQFFPITADQVGKPYTLRCVIKVTGDGYVIPVIAEGGEQSIYRVVADTGWQTVTMTFLPQAAGSKAFGIWLLDNQHGTDQHVYVDEFTLVPGRKAPINPSKFGSFELNTRSVLMANSVPTDITGKVGDIIFNGAPSSGNPSGWVCSVAGQPGTWLPLANIP